MKRALIGALIFVVYLGCVILAAFALHFSGTRFALFCIVLGLLGGATIAFAVWYMFRVSGEATHAGGSDSVNLDALLRDADRKLRTSRLGVKSMAAAQIIYIVGEDNSAKTQTVLQSGLDAELLAGNLLRDGEVAPTQLANIWLAGSSVIVEAGGSLLQQPALWQRLIKATRPGKLASLFAKAASQPPRAVVVCVSLERIPGSTEPGYNANQIRSSAQALNERLRQLSQALGISVPVYVLFTKLDRLQHFADYVGRLSADEVKAPLGSLLAQLESGSGLYAERASTLISTHLDQLTYALAEFRIEALSRGGDLKILASGYEFPRDLQKRRSTIVDFLVELTRPSQLGINPFLRGFFFSGLRSVIVEEVAADPVQEQANNHSVPEGATQVFLVGGAQIVQPQQQRARTGSRKVAQWAFLPHLFSKLLLADKSALEASRASIKVNVLKRVLLACACSCIVIYLVLVTFSFFNNREIAQRVSALAAAPVYAASPTQLASVHDLETLDQLGKLLLQLDSYRKDGAPPMNRWGLYIGDELYPITCNAYSTKFRALLLAPAQENIISQLRSLPSSPATDENYEDTYKPLAAYLITTSDPDKSTTDFLPPALLEAWKAKAKSPLPDLNSLAQTQFQTYAHFRTDPESCLSANGRPDADAVADARKYLSRFQPYQSMLASANLRFKSIRFKDAFPDSVDYLTDDQEVKGAFTKSGFEFMWEKIQHPDRYYAGEKWVLGEQAAPSVDTSALSAQYVHDYIGAWRCYLNAAKFVRFQGWTDAARKLDALGSRSSAILELFSLISINTSITQSEIANSFQAPQSIIPRSTPLDSFITDGNKPYITGLQGLKQAVEDYTQNPSSATDPNAASSILRAANIADQAVQNLQNGFHTDLAGKVDQVSLDLLEYPIKSVRDRIRTIDPVGGAGKAFCDEAKGVLGKFPFDPKSKVEASPEDVAQIFSPVQGALDQLYSKIGSALVYQGGRYVAAAGTQINPKFLSFFNAAKRVSNALFPNGGIQPTFALTEAKTVPDAMLNIDGKSLSAGQTDRFPWRSSPTSRITLTSAQNSVTISTGSWSVFHLGLDAIGHPTANSFVIGLGPNAQASETVRFDVTDPNPSLISPHFMDQLRCVPTIAKP